MFVFQKVIKENSLYRFQARVKTPYGPTGCVEIVDLHVKRRCDTLLYTPLKNYPRFEPYNVCGKPTTRVRATNSSLYLRVPESFVNEDRVVKVLYTKHGIFIRKAEKKEIEKYEIK